MTLPARWLLATFTVLLLAGCTEPADVVASTDGSWDLGSPPQDDESTPPDIGKIPTWNVGDWWSWSIEPRDTAAFKVTTIVASASGSTYNVGWNDLDLGLRSQFFHFIPNSDVDATDLTWEAHGVPVKWMDFPLHDGMTFSGGFWITDMEFTVRSTQVMTPGVGAEPGFSIHGEGDEGQVAVDILWSPSVKMFTSQTFYLYGDVPWMIINLESFGSAHAGPIVVLDREDMVIVGTNILWQVESRQAPPTIVDVDIPSGVTHYSMGCYLGGAPGRYEAAFWKEPARRNGCLTENLGTNDEPLQLAWGEITPGDWRLESTTGGPGQVFVELFLIRAETL